MRAIAISLLVAGCAIKPPPAEPSEPPETWAKPSVQRDCDQVCSDVRADYRARCVAKCESPPRVLRCGLYIDHRARRESGLPRSVAIAVVVGWFVASYFALGTVDP